VKTPHTLEEFMARALAIEQEAALRYEEFADSMETHNNPEVAQLFRTMAGYESKHAAQIMAEMGWTSAPPVPDGSWPSFEPPESAPHEQVHYLMQPWHALQVALQAEQRAEAFFAELARVAPDGPVREAALKLQAEEREHVELVKAWLAKVPEPDRDWETDPDPPRLVD